MVGWLDGWMVGWLDGGWTHLGLLESIEQRGGQLVQPVGVIFRPPLVRVRLEERLGELRHYNVPLRALHRAAALWAPDGTARTAGRQCNPAPGADAVQTRDQADGVVVDLAADRTLQRLLHLLLRYTAAAAAAAAAIDITISARSGFQLLPLRLGLSGSWGRAGVVVACFSLALTAARRGAWIRDGRVEHVGEMLVDIDRSLQCGDRGIVTTKKKAVPNIRFKKPRRKKKKKHQ